MFEDENNDGYRKVRGNRRQELGIDGRCASVLEASRNSSENLELCLPIVLGRIVEMPRYTVCVGRLAFLASLTLRFASQLIRI
jgi:hypothetical protein